MIKISRDKLVEIIKEELLKEFLTLPKGAKKGEVYKYQSKDWGGFKDNPYEINAEGEIDDFIEAVSKKLQRASNRKEKKDLYKKLLDVGKRKFVGKILKYGKETFKIVGFRWAPSSPSPWQDPEGGEVPEVELLVKDEDGDEEWIDRMQFGDFRFAK